MTDAVDTRLVLRDIDRMAGSHQRLAEHLGALDDLDPATPSLLPGWTIGHVLTHIARNADSMLRMLAGLPQYWNGFESRQVDIEHGARREWQVLVTDVVATADAVERRMREVGDWSGTVAAVSATRPKAALPSIRRREVEIHRVDLGLGYGFADLPADYVRADLRQMEMRWTARQPMGMTALPPAVLALPEHQRLAWLTGRIELPGLEPAAVL